MTILQRLVPSIIMLIALSIPAQGQAIRDQAVKTEPTPVILEGSGRTLLQNLSCE